MVGFTDPEKLEQEFLISIVSEPSDPNALWHLLMKVREDSIYKEDYTEIEVWVNNQSWMPIHLIARSVQGDLYDLKWHNIQINKTIPKDIFKIEIPAHFRKNRHPLEQ